MSGFEAPNADRVPESDADWLADRRRLRILVVGDFFPWPARDGYRIRFSSVLNALSEIGDIDLFVGTYEGEEIGEPPNVLRRYEIVIIPSVRPSLRLGLRTGRSPLPSRILWREWEEARTCIRRFVRDTYDLVWYSHADSFVALGDPSYGPAVVDFFDLEYNILRRTYSPTLTMSTRTGSRVRGPRWDIATFARWALNRRDRFLWSRLQRKITKEAASTVVCSEVDRKRLMETNVTVIPNSYNDPGPPSDSITVAPILVMVALFTYQPNLDGANWLAHHVLPELRRLVPDVRIRLVGRHDERLPAVALVPGVEIVGQVDNIAPELRGARGVVVPILNGSGTRIKILEALAYGLPIVTTEIGCEGLGIKTDHHAMVRDDPLEFAAACAEILTSDAICERLRRNGRDFYLEHYGTDTVAEQIRKLALEVACLYEEI